MPINYDDIDLGTDQLWSALNNTNLTATVDAGYGGTVRARNLFIEVEYQPSRKVVGDRVSSWVFGVESSGLGTGDIIWNPALVIKSILETFLEFAGGEIDSASFTQAASDVGDLTFSFSLQQQRGSWGMLSELALQARCYLFGEAGEYKIKFRPALLGASDRSITDTGVNGFIAGTTRLRPLGLEYVFNRIVVKYAEDYRRTDEPFRLIAVAEDAVSQAAYGAREQIINAWAIRTTVHAQNLADYLLAQQKEPRYLYKFQSYTGNFNLERGDVVDITDSKWNLTSAKGQVVAIRFMPGVAISKTMFRVEVTVLLEPYRWTWTESGDDRYSPGSAGLMFSGVSGILATTESGGTITPVMRFDSSNSQIYIKGRVVMRQTLANATAYPLDWDAVNYRLKFALSDNSTVMELGGDGNLYLPESGGVDRQTIAFAGGSNEIDSDGSNLWLNVGGIRIAESDGSWLDVAAVIVENANQNQIL